MPEVGISKRLLKWLVSLFVFVFIPALLLYAGFSRIFRLNQNQRQQVLEQKIEAELAEMVMKNNTEGFLAKKLWEAFYSAKEAQKLKNIIGLRRELNDCFDYIAWDNFGNAVSFSIPPGNFSGNWQLTLDTINKTFTTRSNQLKFSRAEETNFKLMFGPQAIPEALKESIYDDNTRLAWPDVAQKFPCLWLGKSKYTSIFVFVKPEVLEKKLGLDSHVAAARTENFSIGYQFQQKTLVNDNSRVPQQLQNLLREKYSINRQNLKVGSYLFFQRQINEDLKVFAYFDRTDLSPEGLVNPYFAVVFFILMLLPYIVSSYRSMVLQQNLRFSLALKLGLLFMFSAGLPLSVLFFVGYDYFNQKEFALYDEIHQHTTRYLQNFDERFESEYAHRIVIIQNALRDYLPILGSHGIEPGSFFPFVEKISQDLHNPSDIQIFLIASSSKTVGTERLIYSDKRTIRRPGISIKKSDTEEAKIYCSIGRFILDSVNGQPADEKISTEVELLTESALQKNLYELQQEFISADGKIRQFGLGQRNSPAYVDLIPLSGNKKQDFLLLAYWDEHRLERIYLDRQFLNANRNINNLKIFAASEEAGRFFPADLIRDRKLRKYVDSFTQKPHPSRQFIELNHNRYLIMGFRTKFMKNYCLFALYPVEEVEKSVYNQKRMLISAAVLAILILSSLAYLLVNSFILPLKTISKGAEAIKSRDFDMRLPPLGYDEFGDIARVFNETMVDFEELKVAGIVQEQLLPKSMLSSEKLAVKGKSVSMGDVGGDYFDYFPVAPGKIAMIIGDVSGHGVGAALIMAMAKAAILQSQNLLEKPRALLEHLHGIIQEIGVSGEKRFMSLQYLCFDENNSLGTYANAGGFPPLRVDPKNRVATELLGRGPLLGAMKRPRFSEEPFSLHPGQALILYTDGMVETLDRGSKETGLDHFKRIVVEAYNQDPEAYCNAILSQLQVFAPESKPADDCTIVVMIKL